MRFRRDDEYQVKRWGGQGEGVLWRRNYKGVGVFVVTSPKIREAVVSRGLWGRPKRDQFRGAVAEMVENCGTEALGEDWPAGDLTEVVTLRGADHARPKDPAKHFKRNMVRTAIRMSRRVKGVGKQWTADMVGDEHENLETMYRANELVVWDGCSASGSTIDALFSHIKRQNEQRGGHLSRILLVCPFMGGHALWVAKNAAQSLGIKLTVLCFGVYYVVAANGYEGKRYTDIVVPGDSDIDATNSVTIPEDQIEIYRACYGIAPDQRGPCLVGDVGASMAYCVGENGHSGASLIDRVKEQLHQYVSHTIKEWRHFCGTPVPAQLLVDERDLTVMLAQLEREAMTPGSITA